MKFFLFFVFSLTLFFQFNCQSPPPSTPAVSWGPETIPNSTIRKIEIDQIRIGDNMIRASAVLGTATEISHKANASVHTWWLTHSVESEAGYVTLKSKPTDVSKYKYIKLVSDSKRNIIDKEMDL